MHYKYITYINNEALYIECSIIYRMLHFRSRWNELLNWVNQIIYLNYWNNNVTFKDEKFLNIKV